MKIIGEGLSIFLTIINIIGTFAITALIIWLDKCERDVIIFINIFINIIPNIFFMALLMVFCIDECSKMYEESNCSGSNCNCQVGDLRRLICSLILFVILFIFSAIILAFFFIIAKLM